MNEPIEEWRTVEGYPAYEVSDQGRVRSHQTHRGNPGPRFLNPGRGSKGYLTVTLSAGGPGRTFKVHTLVTRAFLGPMPQGLEVRHLDSNPANNKVENLAYGTYEENLQDKIALKTHCKSGHPLSGPNMYYRPNSRARACRECLRISDRKRRANRVAA